MGIYKLVMITFAFAFSFRETVIFLNIFDIFNMKSLSKFLNINKVDERYFLVPAAVLKVQATFKLLKKY